MTLQTRTLSKVDSGDNVERSRTTLVNGPRQLTVVHSALRLHMPSPLPADPTTPYPTPHNKLQCSILAITDTPTRAPTRAPTRPGFLGLPGTQVSNTRTIWFLPSPPLSLLSPCQRGLRVVATRCGVVRRRVRGRSTRHRLLHTLPSASLPRTTRLSRILPPTVNTRPRRTRGKEARRPLWAARWMDECRV